MDKEKKFEFEESKAFVAAENENEISKDDITCGIGFFTFPALQRWVFIAEWEGGFLFFDLMWINLNFAKCWHLEICLIKWYSSSPQISEQESIRSGLWPDGMFLLRDVHLLSWHNIHDRETLQDTLHAFGDNWRWTWHYANILFGPHLLLHGERTQAKMDWPWFDVNFLLLLPLGPSALHIWTRRWFPRIDERIHWLLRKCFLGLNAGDIREAKTEPDLFRQQWVLSCDYRMQARINPFEYSRNTGRLQCGGGKFGTTNYVVCGAYAVGYWGTGFRHPGHRLHGRQHQEI